MIMAFHTTCLKPHRFFAYLEAYAREGWAIERAVIGDCAGSYFVEIGTLQRVIQMWRHADVAEWTERRAQLVRHAAWKAFRAAQAESITAEFERLLKPAPFMPVKNLTNADDFVEMRVYRAHANALDHFLRFMRRKGSRFSSAISAIASAISAASPGASTRSCIFGAIPISTIGSSGARRYSPTRPSRRSSSRACRTLPVREHHPSSNVLLARLERVALRSTATSSLYEASGQGDGIGG